MKKLIKKCFIIAFFVLALIVFNQIECSAFSDGEVPLAVISTVSDIAGERPFYIAYWPDSGTSEVHIIKSYSSDMKFFVVSNRYIRFNIDKIYFDFYSVSTDGSVTNESLNHFCFSDNAHNYGSAIIYTTVDIYSSSDSDEIFFNGSSENIEKKPYIVNSSSDLASGNFKTLIINPVDYDIQNNYLYLHMCKNISAFEDTGVYYSDHVIPLNFNGKYYESYGEEGSETKIYYFSIDITELPYSFDNGEKYIFYLSSSASSLGGAYTSDTPLKDDTIFSSVSFTVGGLSDSEKQTNAIISSNNKTTEAIKENTETNKSILGKIGDILNFINPFSDKFFGKVLVDLILDGLKSLFVPSDDFFSNWLDDLNQYFSDVFGILYYPFDLLIDFLNRFSNIAGSDPIINIPEFKLEFMGFSAVLIKSFSYNFNDLLTNDTLKTIHNIYLTFVDIILWLGIVYLASNLMKHIIGSMSGEVIDDVAGSEQSYNNYKQAQQNKARYSQEQYEKDMSRYKK